MAAAIACAGSRGIEGGLAVGNRDGEANVRVALVVAAKLDGPLKVVAVEEDAQAEEWEVPVTGSVRFVASVVVCDLATSQFGREARRPHQQVVIPLDRVICVEAVSALACQRCGDPIGLPSEGLRCTQPLVHGQDIAPARRGLARLPLGRRPHRW